MKTNVMERMKKQIAVFASVCIVAGLAVTYVACSADEESHIEQTSQTLTVDNFSNLGDLHNAFMTHFLQDFEYENVENVSVEDFVDSVANFNIAYCDALDFNNLIDIDKSRAYFEFYKNLIQSDKLNYNLYVKQNTRIDVTDFYFDENGELILESIPNLYELADFCYANGGIEEKAYEEILDIIDLLARNYEGTLSDAEFERRLDNCIDDYNSVGYEINSQDGEFVGAVLAISNASLDWWSENPQAIPNEGKIPTVVAQDVAGALVSGLVNAVGQCVNNPKNKWSWKSFGCSVVGGAVSGSIGMVSKCAKFLKQLF